MFKDIYVKSGLMVLKILTILQQTWVPWLELIARRTSDLIKHELLMNLHVKELGIVIMWTIGHFKESVKGTQILLLSQKTYKKCNKNMKSRLQHITHT